MVKPGFELRFKKSKIAMLGVAMEALQTIDLVRQLPLSEHSDFVLQLHGI